MRDIKRVKREEYLIWFCCGLLLAPSQDYLALSLSPPPFLVNAATASSIHKKASPFIRKPLIKYRAARKMDLQASLNGDNYATMGKMKNN
jgi:hypothetical protein